MKSVADILQAVKDGNLSVNNAEKMLKLDAVAVVGELARIDYNRYLRRGVPEIVYAENKSLEQITAIVTSLAKTKISSKITEVPIILSRVRPEQVRAVHKIVSHTPEFRRKLKVTYIADARLLAIFSKNYGMKKTKDLSRGKVALLAAGTSDISALNEAEAVLNLFDCRTIRLNDVGISAIHRLVRPLKEVFSFDPDAIIVAAGMEGALPSLIAGLSDVPVIGLPTSIGYGYGGKGEAALLSMLQACPLGICVVNIDAGIAAGVVAWLIARRAGRMRISRSPEN